VLIVSVHLPDPEGTAAGRALDALGRGLLDEGHDLTVWSWRPEPPQGEVPAWCEWRPLPTEPRWRTRARALLRPRSDVVAAGWELPDADQAIADDPISYPAIARARHGSVTFHYSARLDAASVGRRTPADVQDARAERRIAARARRVVAFSPRVAEALGHGADFVPIALDPPREPYPSVERPVAACVADWLWPPNRKALDDLLAAWPAVRRSLPAAVLRLAGRGLDDVGSVDGVEVLGPVDRSADVLAGAAAVAFPCPPSSGPKIKVLEAMAGGAFGGHHRAWG
jgi:glycosyltransferase involved in cell wall biosynthesis